LTSRPSDHLRVAASARKAPARFSGEEFFRPLGDCSRVTDKPEVILHPDRPSPEKRDYRRLG